MWWGGAASRLWQDAQALNADRPFRLPVNKTVRTRTNEQLGVWKRKKKNNWTGSVHQFSLWGKLKLLGSYDPGNIQLPVWGDSCSWLNHQNQLRKWNSLTLFWGTTHHLMQRSCSESLQTLRRARKVLSAPKMSGPFLVSQNPRMPPMPCVGKILRAWKSRITLFNKVRAERKENLLYFAIYGYEKKSRRFHEGNVASVRKKEWRMRAIRRKMQVPPLPSTRITDQVPPPACPHTENTKPAQFFCWRFRKVPQWGFFWIPVTKQFNVTHSKLETHLYSFQLLGIQKGIFRLE